jgi:uncharacterized protein (TIGR03083 family)
MDYDHHCTEIVTQAELLSTGIEGADLRAPVPSCPDWTLGMLLRHVGGGHRWAEEMVRTRATGFLADDQVRKLDGDDSADVPATWLMDGATRLAHTLRTAGPGTKVWTPLDLDGTTSFWDRRFAHETLIHRADATLAADTEFTVAEDVALDAIDEWMELDSLPEHFEYKPQKRDLLRPWPNPRARGHRHCSGMVHRPHRGRHHLAPRARQSRRHSASLADGSPAGDLPAQARTQQRNRDCRRRRAAGLVAGPRRLRLISHG